MDFFTTKLLEAKREGYIQALKDLLNDGILSSEEFKKRETEQMAKPFLVPDSHTTAFNKPSYGDQPITNLSPHGFSFGSTELKPSPSDSNDPFGGSFTPTSFSFGQSNSPSKFGNGDNTSPFGGSSVDFTFGQANPISSSLDNSSNSPFGGSTMSPFTFSTTPTPSEFDIRATSGTTSFNSGAIQASNSMPTNNQENSDDDDVNELAAQMTTSTIQVRDFVINEGSTSELQSTNTFPSFKITLVGDGAVGKTAWVNQLHDGTFEQKYIPTVGLVASRLILRTSRGPVRLNIWDTSGQEKFRAIRDGYFIGTHAYVIMFDVTNRVSYANVPNWYRDITQESLGDKKTIVLVGNKCDMKDRVVKPKMILFHRKKNLQYYEMSVKSGYNVEKPFLYLLRKLTADDELQFVSAPHDSKPLPAENEVKKTITPNKPLLNMNITSQQMKKFKEGIFGVKAPVTLPETDKGDE